MKRPKTKGAADPPVPSGTPGPPRSEALEAELAALESMLPPDPPPEPPPPPPQPDAAGG